MSYHRNHGSFTKSYVRRKAIERGYRIASRAQANKYGSWAEIWVWGWDAQAGNIKTCRFYVSQDHPDGCCNFPPVTDTIRVLGGVAANQLGLNLNYEQEEPHATLQHKKSR